MTPQPDTQQQNNEKLNKEKAEAAEKKAALDQQLAMEAAEALKQANIENNEDKRDMTEMVTYSAKKPINATDWELLLEDYEATFNRKPGKDNSLAFESLAQASAFFTKQAEQNREFMCAEANADGVLTGYYMISCGSGKLYEGKLEDIKAAMIADKSNPANAAHSEKYDSMLKSIEAQLGTTKQTTADMRSQMKQVRQETDPPAEEETKSQSSSMRK